MKIAPIVWLDRQGLNLLLTAYKVVTLTNELLSSRRRLFQIPTNWRNSHTKVGGHKVSYNKSLYLIIT